MLRHWLVGSIPGEANRVPNLIRYVVTLVDWGDVERVSWIASVAAAFVAAVSVVAPWIRRRNRPATRIDPYPVNPGAADSGAARLAGASLVAPTSRLPTVVRGRQDLLKYLRRAVRRPPARVQVLAGMGGVGKSTVALALYEWATSDQRQSRGAWWVLAHDQESLTEGLVSLARVLGGNDIEVAAVRAGIGAARDRLWELLEQTRPGWLLVFDNADDPRVFDPDCDGRGWLRWSRRGLVLVTSRARDERLWGRDAKVQHLEPLAEDEAIQVLVDVAPQAVSDGEGDDDVRELARRLGCLPLGLHQVGAYLSARSSRHGSFSSYLRAWRGGADVLASAGIARDRSRAALMRTWELSLDGLARDHVPQARPLLRLLSCYAAATPIPENLLRLPAVQQFAATGGGSGERDPQRWLEDGVESLDQMSLIERETLARTGSDPSVVVHPMVAETNRLHLNSGAVGQSAPSPATIRRTAVELIATSLAPLRSDDNWDWSRYDLLAPHVRELATSTAGHLDHGGLARLLVVTAGVVAFHAWSSYEAAGERLADVLRPHAERLDMEHPARLSLEHERAWAIGRNGRWKEAAALLQPVLDARLRVLGADHADTLDTRHRLAWAAGRLGDWKAADEWLRRVHACRVRLLGTDHPDTLHTRGCLAWAAGQLGRHDEAEAGLREVIETRSRLFGDEHVRTWDCRHSLAEFLVRHARYDEAEDLLRKLVEVRGAVYGFERPETLELRPRYWLACALRGIGRHTEADHEFALLLAEQERALGRDHPATEDTRRQLPGRSGSPQAVRRMRFGAWLSRSR